MAGLREENKWENDIYRIEESDPVVGGEDGISNKPQKQLANRTQWLKAKINELFGKNTPKKITKDTTNLVANDGHTHEIEKGSLTTSGIVQLTDSVNQDSSVFAATAKAVKTAFDKAVAAYNLAAGKANATTNIAAGNGLTGGGQLNANRTIAMGTPSSITATTTNSVTSTSHTHAIEKGSLTTSGIVQLTDSVNQDSSVFAATAKAVKTAYDKAVSAYNLAAGKANSTTNISAGNGLTGGGQINANRTIAMGTPSSITASTTNSVTSTSHTHAIDKGSLTTSGIVQLTDSVNQDSSVFAATAKAVKTAYDKAVSAYSSAANKVSKAGDTMTGVLRAADFVMNRNGNQKLSSLFDALIKLAQGDASGFQSIVNTWGNAGTTPLGITYNFTNPNAWYICFGPFFGNLIIQGGVFDHYFKYENNQTWSVTVVSLPIMYSTKNRFCDGEFAFGTMQYELTKTQEYYSLSGFNFVAYTDNPSLVNNAARVAWISIGT